MVPELVLGEESNNRWDVLAGRFAHLHAADRSGAIEPSPLRSVQGRAWEPSPALERQPHLGSLQHEPVVVP